MSKTCAACKWWYQPRQATEVINSPHPEGMWPCERITHGSVRTNYIKTYGVPNGGSAYIERVYIDGDIREALRAVTTALITPSDFGCVLHEERP